MQTPRKILEFLPWLKAESESAWARYQPRSLADWIANGAGGLDWQTGTHWITGLNESQIADIEKQRGITFPDDHRIFLRMLHATEPPMDGAFFVDGRNLSPAQRPGFYNWIAQPDQIDEAIQNQLDRLGLKKQIEYAPALIPIFGHRFVLSRESGVGSAVFSMYGDDIIVYGGDLRSYLLAELRTVIGTYEDKALWQKQIDNIYPQCRKIPFWGEFL